MRVIQAKASSRECMHVGLYNIDQFAGLLLFSPFSGCRGFLDRVYALLELYTLARPPAKELQQLWRVQRRWQQKQGVDVHTIYMCSQTQFAQLHCVGFPVIYTHASRIHIHSTHNVLLLAAAGPQPDTSVAARQWAVPFPNTHQASQTDFLSHLYRYTAVLCISICIVFIEYIFISNNNRTILFLDRLLCRLHNLGFIYIIYCWVVLYSIRFEKAPCCWAKGAGERRERERAILCQSRRCHRHHHQTLLAERHRHCGENGRNTRLSHILYIQNCHWRHPSAAAKLDEGAVLSPATTNTRGTLQSAKL